jgi:hypothetical protein
VYILEKVAADELMSQQEVKMKYKIKEERLKFSDGILWNRIYLTFVFQA